MVKEEGAIESDARRDAHAGEDAEPNSSARARPRVVYLLADLGIPLYSTFKAGGVHARSMIRAFEAEGADVDVYTLRTGKAGERLSGNVSVHRVKRGVLRKRWARFFRSQEMPPWANGVEVLMAQRDFLRRVRGAMRHKPGPDLVYARHVWLPRSLPKIQERLGVPLYLEVNAIFAREKSERGELAFPKLTAKLEHEALNTAHQILPVSQGVADAISDYGISDERIRVTPNAVDLSLFRPMEGAEPSPSADSPFTIGHVSGFRRYHGLETLLKSALLLQERIGPVRLLLVGDGPMRERIQRIANRSGLGDSVTLTGAVTQPEVSRYLSASHVCVAPYEGDKNLYNCPMKLYEYMAMKKPIVASNWGDIPNIVSDEETAILHEPGSPDSLANALERVHSEPEEARKRCESAWIEVQKHTWRGVARSILDDALNMKKVSS